MRSDQFAGNWNGGNVDTSTTYTWFRAESLSVCLLVPLILFIAGVSVHDAVLLIQNQEVIGQFERNPMGQWLLALGNNEVWLFVSVKLLGTAIVCTSIVALCDYSRKLGYMTAVGLATFQASLLFYLCTN